MTAADEGGTGPVIRDNRRIDPATGQPRRGKHAATGSAGPSGSGRSAGGGGGQHRKGSSTARETAANAKSEEAAASTAASAAAKESASKEAEELKTQLAERTADLQRLQAEYTNYRKRVDRDRATVRELAIASALNEMLPVLDAIGQAREHGELSGGFKSVADSLQAAMSKLGLVSYGERGDAFDPKIHEALTSSYSPDVTEETCVEIFQPGYRIGERILRPARVAVAEPATGPDGASNTPGDTDN
jgi:molecular chaperone GrpE